MSKFRVIGAYKDTGEPADVTFTAHDQEHAEAQAFDKGILISETTYLVPPQTAQHSKWMIYGMVSMIVVLMLAIGGMVIYIATGQSETHLNTQATASETVIHEDTDNQKLINHDVVKTESTDPANEFANHPLTEKGFSPEIVRLVFKGKIKDWIDANQNTKSLLASALSVQLADAGVKYSPKTIENCMTILCKTDDGKAESVEAIQNEKITDMLIMNYQLYQYMIKSPMDDAMRNIQSVGIFDLGIDGKEFDALILKMFGKEHEFKYKEVNRSGKFIQFHGTCRTFPFGEFDIVMKDNQVHAVQFCAVVPDKRVQYEKTFQASIEMIDQVVNEMFSIGAVSGWIAEEIKNAGVEKLKQGYSVHSTRFGYGVTFALVFPEQQARHYILITREKPW